MNARVGPVSFPTIQIGLRIFQALEALAFERSLLRMTDARFDLAFAIRVLHSAWKRCDAVVLQHVTVQRIERGLVNVRREHAFAQVIEHHHAGLCEGPDYAKEERLSGLGLGLQRFLLHII